MAYKTVSHFDVVDLLESNGYTADQETIEKCLHEVFGFSKQRQGEFGIVEVGESLREEDVGKNRWYETLDQEHRAERLNKICTGKLYIGYERKDEVWLKYGNPSDQIQAEVRNDPSYNYEVSQLGKRRFIS